MKLHFFKWDNQTGSAGSLLNRPHRESMIFLHGLGGTGQLWRPIAANLENSACIFAPDQRGHGGSRPVPRSEYTFEPDRFARDLEETFSIVSHAFPAWLIGHSMGVRTACAFAKLFPQLVKGLVFVDLGLKGPAGGGLGQMLYDFLEKIPFEFANRAHAREILTTSSPDPSIAQYLLAVGREEDGKFVLPLDRDSLLLTLDAAKHTDTEPWIEKFGEARIPILFLRGGESHVWNAEEFQAARARFGHFSSFQFMEILGTGHGLPFHKRKEFVEALKNFIFRAP